MHWSLRRASGTDFGGVMGMKIRRHSGQVGDDSRYTLGTLRPLRSVTSGTTYSPLTVGRKLTSWRPALALPCGGAPALGCARGGGPQQRERWYQPSALAASRGTCFPGALSRSLVADLGLWWEGYRRRSCATATRNHATGMVPPGGRCGSGGLPWGCARGGIGVG